MVALFSKLKRTKEYDFLVSVVRKKSHDDNHHYSDFVIQSTTPTVNAKDVSGIRESIKKNTGSDQVVILNIIYLGEHSV